MHQLLRGGARNFPTGADYSKNPHKRTGVFGLQADCVLIYRVLSAKTA